MEELRPKMKAPQCETRLHDDGSSTIALMLNKWLLCCRRTPLYGDYGDKSKQETRDKAPTKFVINDFAALRYELNYFGLVSRAHHPHLCACSVELSGLRLTFSLLKHTFGSARRKLS